MSKMLDCIRRLGLFRRGYNSINVNEDIELENMSPDLGKVLRLYFFSEHRKLLFTERIHSNLKFFPTGLDIGNKHIRYEWIASLNIMDNKLCLLTFTDIDNNKIIKCDKLSYIIIHFDNDNFHTQFIDFFTKRVHNYAKLGKFDGDSIRNMDSFKRVLLVK